MTSVKILEEMGEETDGVVESTSKLQEKIEALSGVDILTDAGEYKDTYTILREIGNVWEDMSDIDQAALLELMAGKNRANTLSAILGNMEDLEGAYESAMNAEGSAAQELDTYMNSIQGRIDQFNNSVQTMWMNFLNSDALKFIINFGTAAIKLVDTLGVIPTLLGAITAYKFGEHFIKQNLELAKMGYSASDIWKKEKESLFGLKDLTKKTSSENAQDSAEVIAAKNAAAADNEKTVSAKNAAAADDAKVVAANNFINSMNTDSSSDVAETIETDAAQRVALAKEKEIAAAERAAAADEAKAKAALNVAESNTAESTASKQASNANISETASSKQVAQANADEAAQSKLAGQANADEAAQSKLAGQADADEAAQSKLAAGADSGEAGSSVGSGVTGAAIGGLKGLAIGVIVGIISSLLSKGLQALSDLIPSAEKTAQKAKEALDAYEQSTDALKEQKSTIDEISASYERLSKGVDVNTNENISLTTQSYEEYLDICNDVADMYPHLVTGFDAQGNAILSLKGNVDELAQAYKDAAQTARQQMIAGGGDIFSAFKTSYSNSAFSVFDSSGYKEKVEIANALIQAITEGEDAAQALYTAFGDKFGILNKVKAKYNLSDSYWMGDVNNLFKDAGVDTSFDASFMIPGFSDFEKLKQQLPKLQSYVKSATALINTETNKVKSLMDAYLGEDLDYITLSEKNRAYVDQIISSFNAEFVSGFDNADSLYNWIKTNVVEAFQDPAVVDIIESLSNLQLDFTKGDITYTDYISPLSELLRQLETLVGTDTSAQIQFALGIDLDSLQVAKDHIRSMMDDSISNAKITERLLSLSVEDLQIAGQLEVPEGTLHTWDELLEKIEEAKIAATADFNIADYTDAISSHSAAISEYQEALQSLGKGSFTMDDFMELIKKYPELAKGVDISSNAFYGLSRNLNRAIKTSTKSFIKDLKDLRVSLEAAEKSTDSIDQLIEAIENMPDDALDDTIQKYSTLADKIDKARLSQDKLIASMEENPNEGYETRGEAMEYMKEAMKKGEIGSGSNLWNVAEKYGFTYDSAKTINENADALANYIATRERWFKEADDGDDRTSDDGYSYEGTENFIKDVESAVKNNAELQKYLTWEYDENTGTFKFEHNNEDWDTIVSILSNTKELAGLTSDEFADMMAQVEQYFGIDWGNYDDVLSHLNKIATGTSDAKTKVEEYGQAMQDHFGDNSDVDLTTRPMVKFDSTNFAEWEKLYQEIINNPDGHSEADVKNAQEQLASIQKGDSYATVYSSTFSNEDGTKSVVVTPILPDGKVLSPKQLEEYANKLLAGEELEPGVNIKLAEFDGSNSIQQAGEYAQALHEAQAEYDTLRDTLQINTTVDEKGIEGLKEIKEVKSSIIDKADGTVVIDEDAFREALTGAEYTEDQIDVIIDKIKKLNAEAFIIDPFKIDETLTNKGISALEEIEKVKDSLATDETTGLTILDTDMFTSVLKEAGYTETQIDDLIKKIQEYDNIVSVSGNTDPLGLNNTALKVNELQSALGAMDVHWSILEEDNLVINVKDLVTTLKEKGWEDNAIKDYVSKLGEQTEIDGFNIKLSGGANVDQILEEINKTPTEKETKYEITGTGASTLDEINTGWTEATKDKTTNYTINETAVKTVEVDDNNGTIWDKLFPEGIKLDGASDAQGTAFSGGSWGAPRTETALTGELGPEILVRNGRWTTVGENGAEFTQIKKGDIIFNHKQSEELLKNGHVAGRGKAYASGTAYSTGGGTFARYEFSGSGGWQQYDVNDVVVESWGDLSGAIDKATDSLESASDAADEFEETFDWIEVRLEEINEQLDFMNAQLENAGDYASKNSIIDQIIGANTNKMDNLLAGIEKYSDYAARLLSNVPAQYREAVQDGAIAITEFVGEADEKTVEAIEKYREWAQKVADLKQELEGVKTELRDLAIQKIDNAYDSGSVRATVEDSQTEKLQNAVDYDEERGLITDPNYYAAMMENSNKKIEYLTKARNKMQEEFNKSVQDGTLIRGSDEWYEQLDKLYGIDAEIDEATKELEEFQNAINDIYWDNFDELINRLDYISEEAQGLIDLMDSADMFNKPDNDKGWSDNDVSWTSEGLATLGLHAQKMEQAEEKARAYAEAIDDLNAEYKAGHYSESEYYEKLNDLTQKQYDAIEAAQEEKEAIVELNEQRIEAVKEGIDKQVEAYEELINKQKDALDSEKDLYDFQKSVRDSSKNISDIQRKLAALAGDTSASAIAKRKQLEAELYEAQAEQEDLYYNRSIEDQQTALDKSLESFQEEKEAEKEQLDKWLEGVEQVVTESLGIVQANATEIGKTLTDKTEEYSLTVSDAVLSPWKDGAVAIDEYTTKFGDSVSSTTEQLDTIKSKWQEVKEEMVTANAEADKYYNKDAATAKSPSVADINKENANYAQASKKQPATSNKNINKTTQSAPQYATYTVQSGDTLSGIALDKLGSASRWNEIYNLNKDIISNPDLIYVGQKLKLPKYAKGTLGVKKNQWALIDELGEELVLHAGANGKVEYLTKGSSVIPADLTERWTDLVMNPQEVLDRNRPQITPSKSVVNNNMEIQIDASVGELIHVERLEGGNLNEINKFIDKAWDKKMQGLNNAIRKFTR